MADWPRIFRAASAGSAAPVMARPITRISAPAARAASGVAMRFWSWAASSAGRMPGTTVRKSWPSSVRECLRDHGDCRPRHRDLPPLPAAARLGAWALVSCAGSKPAAQISSLERLVRMVTAMSLARPPTASPAAFIMSRPPVAWRLTIAGRGRKLHERFHAGGHRIGNVVQLEIEKNRQAFGSHRLIAPGAMGIEEFHADLHVAHMGLPEPSQGCVARSRSVVSRATQMGLAWFMAHR